MTVVNQGRYSILSDDWISYPGDPKSYASEDCVEQKASRLRATIEQATEIDDFERLDLLLERLRAFRARGISSPEGEYSVENLVYKSLRRDGTVDKLKRALVRTYDESLSYACGSCSNSIRYTKGESHQPTVAIDLDGTLASEDGGFSDEIGDPRPNARQVVEIFKSQGFKVIVWTCRGDEPAVKKWFDLHDIPYDEINSNSDQPNGTSPKVMADVYLDNKGVDASGDLLHAARAALEKVGQDKQKYAKWIPYTGPRGGHGWKNTETGKVFYGPDPPSEREPAQEGSSPSDSRSGLPEAGEKPAVAPRSGGHPKVDKKLIDHLEKSDTGTEIEGWKKIAIPQMNMTGWSNGDTFLTDEQMARFNADDVSSHFSPETKASGGDKNPSRRKGEPRQFTPDEKETVGSVAKVFGIKPGDVRNDKRLRQFFVRTARNLGFDPDSVGDDATEQALASAKFIERQKPHLESMVDMAKAYGWRGGTEQELASRARRAGHHLVNQAAKLGHTPSGEDTEKDLQSAIQFLQEQESTQSVDTSAITEILGAIFKRPEKITLAHIVGAVIGFWIAYNSVKRRRR